MLCLTHVSALNTTKWHSYLKYSGVKRTWLNPLVGCSKKPGAGLCMVLSKLHYFLELLECLCTLSLFDQKCPQRTEMLAVSLKKLSHEKNLGALCLLFVAQTHKGHSLPPCCVKHIQNIIFALYWNSFMNMQNTIADPYFKQSFSPWT